MAPHLWLSLGLLAGTTGWDGRLAGYQWDIAPRLDWGAEAFTGGERMAVGVRLWNSASRQTVDPSVAEQPAVAIANVEAVGRRRIAERLGLWGELSGGWLRVGYHPDWATFDAGGTPVMVELKSVDTWSAGAALAIERPLAGGFVGGLQAGRRWWRLDTAHRDGGAIEYRRETLGDWQGRFALARRWGRS